MDKYKKNKSTEQYNHCIAWWLHQRKHEWM